MNRRNLCSRYKYIMYWYKSIWITSFYTSKVIGNKLFSSNFRWKCVTESNMTKGLITWWISARAEISLRPPGWNIVAITCSISARAQNAIQVCNSFLLSSSTMVFLSEVKEACRVHKKLQCDISLQQMLIDSWSPDSDGHICKTDYVKLVYFKNRICKSRLFSNKQVQIH